MRYAVAVVLNVEATDAEDADKVVSRLARVGIQDPANVSNTIEVEYATTAFNLPSDHPSNTTGAEGDDTYWQIPEVLWGDGNVNMLTHGRDRHGR